MLCTVIGWERGGGVGGGVEGRCAGFPGNCMIFTSHSENLGKINLTHTIERERDMTVTLSTLPSHVGSQ